MSFRRASWAPCGKKTTVADQEKNVARLQAIMTELLKRRIAGSLERVDAALQRWRMAEVNELEAHSEVLRHVARTEQMAARMVQVGFDRAGCYLRDAFDLGILDRKEFVDLMSCEPEEVEPSSGLA